ncbi:HPr family phosphocarrier protein [Sinosporangium siamense]|uniref:Phosphocarrier protein HPr n=1 Tax=Sinosporangium siamense TaxID=1367973 RepID=A0A919RER4_9ACTN|nr:HPr family phosphocarrier protein [Sinosporangium siamense]GII91064.1 phosphocarrier protein [Sinosporangium siamense]
MPERKVIVKSEVGLHARPAATFVQTAAKAPIEVTLAKADGEPVNAKSILSVLALDVRQGEVIVIRAEGEGSDQLLDDLAAIAAAP